MTNRARLEEFDPAKLQDGLLMAVENVHERLREAREKHRVMVGNPVIETSAQNIDVAGVTVLGYDECHTVLTDSERFSSSIYEHIMGPVMGRTLLEKEGAEHHSSRALVSPLFRAKLLERWRTELVEVVVHELIDRFAPRGTSRSGAGVHLCVPGAGDRAADGTAPRGLCALPAVVDRAAQRDL